MGVFILNDGYEMLKQKYFYSEPSAVNGKGNISYIYWRNYLMRLVVSTFKFNDFPTSWDIDYFRQVLFYGGYIGVSEFNDVNMALNCAYSGLNPYGKPSKLIFTNPVLGTYERTLGVDSELIYFDYFNEGFESMVNLVDRYAVLLATVDGSLNTSLLNSRVAYVFACSSKAQLRSLQKIYDDVTKGKPAVFMLGDDINKTADILFNNVKQNYIGNDLIVTKQSIINEFCTHIGITNSNTQKKERLISDEVESNNQLTKSLSDLWIDNLNRCFDKVRELYPYIKTTVSRNENMSEVIENGL